MNHFRNRHSLLRVIQMFLALHREHMRSWELGQPLVESCI